MIIVHQKEKSQAIIMISEGQKYVFSVFVMVRGNVSPIYVINTLYNVLGVQQGATATNKIIIILTIATITNYY